MDEEDHVAGGATRVAGLGVFDERQGNWCAEQVGSGGPIPVLRSLSGYRGGMCTWAPSS